VTERWWRLGPPSDEVVFSVAAAHYRLSEITLRPTAEIEEAASEFQQGKAGTLWSKAT
jgi:hypothetical protein